MIEIENFEKHKRVPFLQIKVSTALENLYSFVSNKTTKDKTVSFSPGFLLSFLYSLAGELGSSRKKLFMGVEDILFFQWFTPGHFLFLPPGHGLYPWTTINLTPWTPKFTPGQGKFTPWTLWFWGFFLDPWTIHPRSPMNNFFLEEPIVEIFPNFFSNLKKNGYTNTVIRNFTKLDKIYLDSSLFREKDCTL